MSRYTNKLQDIRWLSKRANIIIRDGSRCRYCQRLKACKPNGSPLVTLEVHHFEYSETSLDPWDVPDADLITLCSQCHEEIMKSKNRDRGITGQREKERVARHAELLGSGDPHSAAAQILERRIEIEHQQRFADASKCRCSDCVAYAESAPGQLDAEIAKYRALGVIR